MEWRAGRLRLAPVSGLIAPGTPHETRSNQSPFHLDSPEDREKKRPDCSDRRCVGEAWMAPRRYAQSSSEFQPTYCTE